MQAVGMPPADDPRYRSGAMGTFLSDPPQHHHQFQDYHHHQHQHQQQNEHHHPHHPHQQLQLQHQHQHQPDGWEGRQEVPGLAGGLHLSEQEAWLQQQHLEAQVRAMHMQQRRAEQRLPDGRLPADGRLPDGLLLDGRLPNGQLVDGRLPDGRLSEVKPEIKHEELQRAAGGSAEAAMLHAGWAADGGGGTPLGNGSGGGRVTPELLVTWPASQALPPLDAAAGGAELALPSLPDGLPLPMAVQATMQQPLANGIPQLRKVSVGGEDVKPHLPPLNDDGSRRFISLSDPTVAAPQQLPTKMPAPAPRPELGAGQQTQQAGPSQPLNPFQAASLTNERFASPPPLSQPLQVCSALASSPALVLPCYQAPFSRGWPCGEAVHRGCPCVEEVH
jgi:hypothetical protein